MSDRLTRIAIVSNDRCKPKKCRQECKKSCPVVRTGKIHFFTSTLDSVFCCCNFLELCRISMIWVIICVITGRLCIEVTSQSKIAYISEELCIGCGICVKVLKIPLSYCLLCLMMGLGFILMSLFGCWLCIGVEMSFWSYPDYQLT